MRKKIVTLLATIATICCFAFGVSACNMLPSGTSSLETSSSVDVSEESEESSEEYSSEESSLESAESSIEESSEETSSESSVETHTHTYLKLLNIDALKSEATCTTPAIYHTSCACGELGAETFEYGKANGHTEEILQAVAPTCTETGLTEGKKCSVCNETLVAQEVVKANGHTEEILQAVEPTCTETGLTEGKKCSVCNETLVAQEVVKANGHTYKEEIIKPTKREQGYTIHSCENCEDSYIDTYVPATGSLGLLYSKNADGITCTVTGLGDCTDTELVIGQFIDGYKVTAIGSSAFLNCSGLTSVEIPNNVTSIGDGAFRGCKNLVEMTLPFTGASKSASSYQRVFGYIFGYTKHESFTFNQEPSVSIGAIRQYREARDEAGYLSYCYDYYIPTSLRRVTISDNIKEYAFYGCGMLTSVEIGDSAISIGRHAFYNCTKLTSITIPDSVTSIGDYAFYGCSNLTSVVMGNSIASIGNSVFRECSRLASITIPNSVTSIGGSAFSHCTNLTSIIIGNSVASIGGSAFSHCSSLTSITIPNSVTSIGSWAFSSCSSLTSITIPNSVTSIGDNAFSHCNSLTTIYYNGTAQEWTALKANIGSGNTYLTNATIYYYVENEVDVPTDGGNYWHYVNGVPTKWD